ncbi:hypothetical protein [uncultured Psychrobacter sp.]|uniref:hypothetical protein n=1 Tax=uncultured Psychrobacter sp. TaxID=259303 RepID=UPI0032B15808|tara:strand:+ start:1827 stop:2138 length:312 start_codon:yes stop_codon:yes gene_type:complete
MIILETLSTLSIIVIAIVCAMTIIKYHRELGSLVTLTILFFALSCVGLAFDETTGRDGVWALPIFRMLAAAATATTYFKLRAFWTRYGVFISAINQSKKDNLV